MFAEMKEIDFLFARSSSLSRPASLDLDLLRNRRKSEFLRVYPFQFSVSQFAGFWDAATASGHHKGGFK
jgi:hypothetical protein